MSLAIAIAGVSGRTGREVAAACRAAAHIECAGAIVSPSNPLLVHTDAASGPPLTSDPNALPDFDVLVDFSIAALLPRLLDACERRERALVVGTTGHDAPQLERLRLGAQRIPIVLAPNTSVGVNVMLRLAREAAGALPPEYDARILDVHHRFKRDAPSGTALALRDAVGAGDSEREPASISSVRIGGRPGDHSLLFGSDDETLTLAHSTHSRAAFAAGALRAAAWVAGREPGLYTMQHVLFGAPLD